MGRAPRLRHERALAGPNAATYTLRTLDARGHTANRTRTWGAVLFDVEGVIAHADAAAADQALARRWPGVSHADVQGARNSDALYPAWETYSCGKMSSTAYWSAVLAHMGLEADPGAVDHMRALQASTAWACLDASVLAIVRNLRVSGRVRLGILSNSAVDYEAHIARFETLFDVVCFSHRIGARKPGEEAFRLAARALGAAARDTVFIDDRERNRVAAASIGFHPVAFTDAPALVRDLAALGLLDART
jgi:HAD superfamily hydrolase (TIGR01509 family)